MCVEPFFTVWNPPPNVFVRIQQSELLGELNTYLQTQRGGAFAQANTTAGNFANRIRLGFAKTYEFQRMNRNLQFTLCLLQQTHF